MNLYLTTTLRTIEAKYAGQPLMQRAGLSAAEWAIEIAGDRPGSVLVLAGPGNNGGDAYVAALALHQRGIEVCTVAELTSQPLPPDAAAAQRAFFDAGLGVVNDIPATGRWSLVIDGLFGVGLNRAPSGLHAEWINRVNTLSCPILALDCPSGLNTDTGRAWQPCIRATHTLTFIALKPGLLMADGPDHCGQCHVAGLGLDLEASFKPDGRVISRRDFAAHLEPRSKNTHKGSFGNAGILGGSKSMVGAALLAGHAALKLGAGRVYLGLMDADAPSVDPTRPEIMIRRADTLLGSDLTAIACGPGLGQSSEASRLLEQAIKAPLAIVLDADALNLIARDTRLESNLYNRVGPAILTPHPAEAARLLGCSVPEVQADRIAAACQLARNHQAHVALKGCGTVVATTEGQWWVNNSGNPGMASAGMGDVLTGLITALLAQGWPPESALLCAVHLHGAAADELAAQGSGPIGLTAGETIDAARRLFNAWVDRDTTY